jgi:uncharacterized protein YjbI with pentapeptide repeats
MTRSKSYEPKFSPEIQTYQGEMPSDGKFRDYEFENTVLHFDFSEEFNGCIFKKVRFTGDFKKTSFVDCIFDHCDLSNLPLSGCLFFRVRFDNCKGTGSILRKSKLKFTEFIKCTFSLSDFSESHFEQVRFIDSNFSESAFQELKQTSFITEKVDFTQADFYETALVGMDVSGCRLDGIRLSPQRLKGLTVDHDQAVALAVLLGVKVKAQ